MDQGQLNWITNFIWGIADDVLRDIYVRGKYRDVILPMVVIRRLDAVLEGPAKKALLDMKTRMDTAGIAMTALTIASSAVPVASPAATPAISAARRFMRFAR